MKQMKDVRCCPECSADKGVACRKPTCPQLLPAPIEMVRPNFTPATGKSIHVMIEAIFPIDDVHEIEDALDNLRQYGSAVVTKREFIAEDFDTACKILDQRAWQIDYQK